MEMDGDQNDAWYVVISTSRGRVWTTNVWAASTAEAEAAIRDTFEVDEILSVEVA
jgi:hypothetical protein